MKFTQYIRLIVVGVLWSLAGCIEPVSLELGSGQSDFVVFGWLTNQDEQYQISLTKSNGFNDREAYPLVNDAQVYVYSGSGARYRFVEEKNSGIYFPEDDGFIGEVGESYLLYVIVEEDTLVSTTEYLMPLPKIDSSFVSFVVDPSRFEVQENQANYYVSAMIQDQPNVRNYFRWKVYVNGVLRNTPSELVLFDDLFLDGNRFRVDANNVLFKKGDSVSVVQYSLSEQAYNYYVQLKGQTDNSTLTPNAKPSILEGNISSLSSPEIQVFGYFGASEAQVVSGIQQ
ncbi:DUF4249 domain-containing protein [Reichenbachiella agarivorans]|uniref:DUF4249 domain-containing protein n=1 Tax=Reichenbachiella agarivorans TaxID=2979464 RepID=A0ABY6CPI2_9BACT|nr:DUF4249 domain-containing protein [Reichenbachiella agarivorans]UXP31373.1 DUF4249 domain-containing protein [Reichenbachiella agarivorans]